MRLHWQRAESCAIRWIDSTPANGKSHRSRVNGTPGADKRPFVGIR
jgi:hypothetical protein